MADPVEVLDYWLGEVGEDGWFAGGAALDDEIRERFGDLWQAAKAGGLEHWAEGAVGTLAYLILCDQMSRNMHRGTAEAFATDTQARAAARRAIEAGWDMDAPEPERMFFYMPIRHAENAADQALAVDLVRQRLPADPDMVIHALVDQDIFARFGRFPHRNLALGRESSAEELAYLAGGGREAAVRALKASHAGDA